MSQHVLALGQAPFVRVGQEPSSAGSWPGTNSHWSWPGANHCRFLVMNQQLMVPAQKPMVPDQGLQLLVPGQEPTVVLVHG